MSFIDRKAELNMGAVILLSATLFIGISIGVLAVHTSGILGDTKATTAALSVQDQGSEFTISVYDMGDFNRITFSYNNEIKSIKRSSEVSFQKASSEKELIIQGFTEKSSEGTILRREKI